MKIYITPAIEEVNGQQSTILAGSWKNDKVGDKTQLSKQANHNISDGWEDDETNNGDMWSMNDPLK